MKHAITSQRYELLDDMERVAATADSLQDLACAQALDHIRHPLFFDTKLGRCIAPPQKEIACPLCRNQLTLAYIQASDGRAWVNAACPPCGYAMDENNRWTFYAGGITRES